jgi:hypothetical protein
MSTFETWTDGEEIESGRSRNEPAKAPQRLRHNTFAKRKKPTGFNGIHRRRNKRTAR